MTDEPDFTVTAYVHGPVYIREHAQLGSGPEKEIGVGETFDLTVGGETVRIEAKEA